MTELTTSADSTPLAPVKKKKKRVETATQRRARTKHAEERAAVLPVPISAPDNPSLFCPVDAVTMTSSAQSAPSPAPPVPPAPLSASALAPRCPVPAAALRRVSMPPCAPVPCNSASGVTPRDVLSLVHGLNEHNPWSGIRRRRRRAPRPHRHVRRARASQRVNFAAQLTEEDALVEELRSACFDALGPLYEDTERTRAYGATPIAAQPEELGDVFFAPRLDADCFPELVQALWDGEAIIFPGPRMQAESDAELARIADNLERLPPSVWSAFITVHTFFASSRRTWHLREMYEMQRCYLAGLSAWFLEGNGG
ncbi:hypothetical protein AURDEDRAFT_175407 [Auricularia subglabra TFB-10046 SS5]|nr:hypothetical protein AURDEDRAFT_175407 [Auricularia subglabra TFB-10046 SS5]